MKISKKIIFNSKNINQTNLIVNIRKFYCYKVYLEKYDNNQFDFRREFELNYYNYTLIEQKIFWKKYINQIHFLLNEKNSIKKSQIFEILNLLNHFQPKFYFNLKLSTFPYKPFYSSSFDNINQQKEYFSFKKPNDFIFQTFYNIKYYFIQNSLKLINYYKNNQNLKQNLNNQIDFKLDELLEDYIYIFKNFENKIIDDIKLGKTQYSFLDCIKLIQSFGLSKEGTYIFFDVLFKKIKNEIKDYLLNNDFEINIKVIEIILNCFPHKYFNTAYKREKHMNFELIEFYSIIYNYITINISKYNIKDFLKLFQGYLRINYKNNDLLCLMVEYFNERIKISLNLNQFELIQNENILNKLHFIKYIEIIGYSFISKDLDNIYKKIFISQNQLLLLGLNQFINSLNLKDISTIFWFNYHLEILDEKIINMFDNQIKKLINEAFFNLNKENGKNTCNNLIDIESIIFFTKKYENNNLVKYLKNSLIIINS